MKKISDHPEDQSPVMNGIFIGVYIVALILLMVMLFRRFIPSLYYAFDSLMAF